MHNFIFDKNNENKRLTFPIYTIQYHLWAGFWYKCLLTCSKYQMFFNSNVNIYIKKSHHLVHNNHFYLPAVTFNRKPFDCTKFTMKNKTKKRNENETVAHTHIKTKREKNNVPRNSIHKFDEIFFFLFHGKFQHY